MFKSEKIDSFHVWIFKTSSTILTSKSWEVDTIQSIKADQTQNRIVFDSIISSNTRMSHHDHATREA